MVSPYLLCCCLYFLEVYQPVKATRTITKERGITGMKNTKVGKGLMKKCHDIKMI